MCISTVLHYISSENRTRIRIYYYLYMMQAMPVYAFAQKARFPWKYVLQI